MSSHRFKAFLLLLVTTIIWGVATPVIKFTLAGIAPLVFLIYRFGISSAIAGGYFLVAKPKLNYPIGTLALIFAYGIVTVPLTLGALFFGLEKTTVLESSVITAIAPLTIAMAGALFLREHVTKREKVGMAIAAMGTLLVTLEPIIKSGNGFGHLTGNLLMLLYLGLNAISAVWAKVLVRKKVSESFMTHTSFLLGFVTLLPFALKDYSVSNILSQITSIAPEYHLGVLFMAVFSGTIAYITWTMAQKTIEIGEAGLFSYLYPVFAAPLAVFWLKETIDPLFIVGSGIVLIGVVTAEYKKVKSHKKQ